MRTRRNRSHRVFVSPRWWHSDKSRSYAADGPEGRGNALGPRGVVSGVTRGTGHAPALHWYVLLVQLWLQPSLRFASVVVALECPGVLTAASYFGGRVTLIVLRPVPHLLGAAPRELRGLVASAMDGREPHGRRRGACRRGYWLLGLGPKTRSSESHWLSSPGRSSSGDSTYIMSATDGRYRMSSSGMCVSR